MLNKGTKMNILLLTEFNELYHQANIYIDALSRDKDNGVILIRFTGLLRQMESTIKRARKEKQNGKITSAALESMIEAYNIIYLFMSTPSRHIDL